MATTTTESLTLPVLGMTCASCQHHVEEALRATAGVESAHVDLMAHRANVVFDPALAAPEKLVEAIRGAGYEAVLPRAGDQGKHDEDGLADSGRKAWITLATGALLASLLSAYQLIQISDVLMFWGVLWAGLVCAIVSLWAALYRPPRDARLAG